MYRFIARLLKRERVAAMLIAMFDMVSEAVFVYVMFRHNGDQLVNDRIAFSYTMLCGMVIALDMLIIIEESHSKRTATLLSGLHLWFAITMGMLFVCEVVMIITTRTFGMVYVNMAYEAIVIVMHVRRYQLLGNLKNMVLSETGAGTGI